MTSGLLGTRLENLENGENLCVHRQKKLNLNNVSNSAETTENHSVCKNVKTTVLPTKMKKSSSYTVAVL